MKKYIFVLLLFLVSATPSFGAVSWSGNTCTITGAATVAQINDCLTGAANGIVAQSKTGEITVVLPADTETWTESLVINMTNATYINVTKLTIQGAGTIPTGSTKGSAEQTVINGSGISSAVSFTGSTAKKFRLTNIKFTGAYSGYDGVIYVKGTSKPSSGGGFRIDHNNFNTTIASGGPRVIKVYGYTYGVIDHNNYSTPQMANTVWEGDGIGANKSWNRALSVGTQDAVYLEDNVAVNTNASYLNRMFCDGENGARIVVRYNDTTNYYIGGHDATTSMRGIVQYEAYNNTVRLVGSAAYSSNPRFFLRGGTHIIYNNAILDDATPTGMWSSPIVLQNNRSLSSYQSTSPWGNVCDNSNIKICAGTLVSTQYPSTSGDYCTTDADCAGEAGSCQNQDGNEDATGYPCRDQIGVAPNGTISGQFTKYPSLFWNNTYKGNTTNPSVRSDNLNRTHIQNDRDICYHATTMPASCGGIATTYSAYIYPHPLVGGVTDTTNPDDLTSLSPTGQQACATNPSNVAISLSATDNVAVTGVRCCVENGSTCVSSTAYASRDVVLAYSSGTTWGATVSSACDTDIVYNCMSTDAAGNFSNNAIISYQMADNTDSTVPTMSTQAIGADGRTVTFTFSEAVTIGAGGNAGFTLTNGDAEEISLAYVSGAGSTTLTYQSSACIPSTDTFVAGLVYTQPTNGIEDMAGNDLATFSGAGAKTVTNGSTQSCDLATSLFEHPETAPSGLQNESGNAFNTGIKFQTSVAGTMTHCWFYKIAADTGTHVCTVYRVFDGSTVGTVTFADESESGWQDQAFASALNIAANEDYIVTVSHPTGYWSRTLAYFMSTYTNGNLTATTSGTDYAGRYVYGASMAYPTGDSPSNYWVDFTMSYAGVGGPWQCTVSRTGDGCMITGSQVVADEGTCSATVTLRNGWKATWGGTCPAGSETGGVYTSGPITADCTLIAACTEQNILP